MCSGESLHEARRFWNKAATESRRTDLHETPSESFSLVNSGKYLLPTARGTANNPTRPGAGRRGLAQLWPLGLAPARGLSQAVYQRPQGPTVSRAEENVRSYFKAGAGRLVHGLPFTRTQAHLGRGHSPNKSLTLRDCFQAEREGQRVSAVPVGEGHASGSGGGVVPVVPVLGAGLQRGPGGDAGHTHHGHGTRAHKCTHALVDTLSHPSTTLHSHASTQM